MPAGFWLEWGLPVTGLVVGLAGFLYARQIARNFDRRYGPDRQPAE